MMYKNNTFHMIVFAVAAITFSQQQENYHVVSGAEASVRRGLKKNPKNGFIKGGTKKTKKSSKSSGSDSSELCTFEVSTFDPYDKHMKYHKDIIFDVEFSGVPEQSRTEITNVRNQAKISLQRGLIKHFKKQSFQRHIDDSPLLQSFEFDPYVDMEMLKGRMGYHAGDADGSYSVPFSPPLFSGTIKYVCSDIKDGDELLWELARILDKQLSSSKKTLYKKFTKDFRKLHWNFEDIQIIMSIA